MMTMRRKIAGKSPDQIRRLKRSELEAPVSNEDLLASIEKTRRTVTQSDVDRYNKYVQFLIMLVSSTNHVIFKKKTYCDVLSFFDLCFFWYVDLFQLDAKARVLLA